MSAVEVSAKDVKALRERTGAGMMDCKKALTEAEGDIEKAIEILRVKQGKKIQDLGERAAIIEEGANVPRRWAEGFAAMASMPAPAGFSPERWRRIVDATGTFLDRWAAKVIACGWSDLDVFGCDAAAPDRRFDCMGLVLLLDSWEVSSVDEAGADLVTETGAPLRYRRRPLPGHTVSLWQLMK